MSSESIKAAIQTTLGHRKSLAVASLNPVAATAVLMSVALVYWLWLGLTQRSINGPDAISMTAVIGILEHGIQLFPSGYWYHRGYLPNYLVAGAIQAFGFNEFAMMLPSLVMGLGTLFVTFLIARDILGKPWLGVAAVAVLVLLQMQAYYATGPRMYMALEFFAMLAVYTAWRGYVVNETRYQLATFLALAAALLAHKEAGALIVALLVVIPAALLIIGKERLSRLFTPWTIIGLAVLGSAGYFVLVFTPPNVMPSIAFDDGRAGERIGLHLDFVAHAKHFYNLDRAFPYGLLLIPLGVAAAFNRLRRGGTGLALGPLYLLLTLLLAGLIVSMGSSEVFGTRIWLFVLPLCVLLACIGMSELFHSFGITNTENPQAKKMGLLPAAILLAAGIFLGFGMNTAIRGWQPVLHIQEGYGPPCIVEDCHKSVQAMYEGLRERIGPDHLIVSSRPLTTYYYWRRVDAVVRDKTLGVAVIGREEYLGAPVVDSIAELTDLGRNKKVWVVADANIDQVVNKEVRDYIRSEYELVQSNPYMAVYVNTTR